MSPAFLDSDSIGRRDFILQDHDSPDRFICALEIMILGKSRQY